VVSFMVQLLCLQIKSCWYQFDRNLCEPLTQFGHGNAEKNVVPAGNQPSLFRPTISNVTEFKYVGEI
jgi:hypothetical protein